MSSGSKRRSTKTTCSIDDLQAWLRAEGLSTLIADGEGLASPRLPEMARQRLVNVVQYDIFSYGFTRWLELGARLDRWGARTAPHHYGGHYGNYASGHLASAISRFAFVEWDEATTPGLDGSAYVVSDGWVTVPDEPGFRRRAGGRSLFGEAVTTNGFTVSAGHWRLICIRGLGHRVDTPGDSSAIRDISAKASWRGKRSRAVSMRQPR